MPKQRSLIVNPSQQFHENRDGESAVKEQKLHSKSKPLNIQNSTNSTAVKDSTTAKASSKSIVKPTDLAVKTKDKNISNKKITNMRVNQAPTKREYSKLDFLKEDKAPEGSLKRKNYKPKHRESGVEKKLKSKHTSEKNINKPVDKLVVNIVKDVEQNKNIKEAANLSEDSNSSSDSSMGSDVFIAESSQQADTKQLPSSVDKEAVAKSIKVKSLGESRSEYSDTDSSLTESSTMDEYSDNDSGVGVDEDRAVVNKDQAEKLV
jgi:hypothetical protein